MSQDKATPRPWAVNPVNAQIDAFDTGVPVPVCQMLWPTELRSEAATFANASLIVRAVNEREELIAALADLLAWCSGYEKNIGNEMAQPYIDRARAILTKARTP